MDPLLTFFLGAGVAVVVCIITILVAIKIYRKQKKEAKENTAHLSTDHNNILRKQERQERIQKKLVIAFYEIITDEYPDMLLAGDSRVVLENTAWTTAETMANLPAITEDEDPPKDQD